MQAISVDSPVALHSSDQADISTTPAGSLEQRSVRSAEQGTGHPADVFEEQNGPLQFTHVHRRR